MQGLFSKRNILKDSFFILVGSFIYALGVDCFQIPFGIAAGGVTGMATVIHAALLPSGIDLPVGTQTIVFNILLMIPVFRQGGVRYIVRVCMGIIASGFFLDVLSPFVPSLEGYDLFLAVLWGGIVSGFGLGIVFRAGGNTGGVDIIAQYLSKKTHGSIGSVSMIVNIMVIVSSISVFGLRNALYAAVCMYFTGKVIDLTIDGPKNERAAFIISTKHREIANLVMYEMGRGCTEVQARGVWSGNARPMLFVLLGKGELGFLKTIVSEVDPEAIVAISEVHEAFGQGFKDLSDKH